MWAFLNIIAGVAMLCAGFFIEHWWHWLLLIPASGLLGWIGGMAQDQSQS